MSDHDRGAYTPPTDDYLAFDARTARVRRPIPATLLGSAVVLVVLVGAVVLFYRSGVRGANEAPPAVGKTVMTVKSAPVVDAKPLPEDGQGLEVYNEEKGQAATAPAKPAFAPGPEAPAARQTQPAATAAAAPSPVVVQPAPPPAPTVAAAPPPVTTPAPVRTAQAHPLRAAQPAPTDVSPRPAKAKPAPDPIAERLAESAPAKAAPVKTPKPVHAEVASGAVHGVTVQFGAFASAAIADEQFAKTKAKFASFTASKAKHVERTERDGKAFYRTAFTGFTKPQAKAFCDALIAAGGHCIMR